MSLTKGYLGDLRATSLADLARKLFFDVIFLSGVCGSQGLYNSSRCTFSRINQVRDLAPTVDICATQPLLEKGLVNHTLKFIEG